MNRIKLVLGLLAAGAVCSASAQLQFTNLTLSTSPSLFHGLTNQLNSVVFGGSSNFLAVGANQIYVYGNYQLGQTWITNSGWVTNQILPANKLNLASVIIGNNIFVTTGTSNAVFSAANTPAGLSWSRTHNIFSSSVFASALAYNNGAFSAVAEAPQISWSSASLPVSTAWVPGTLANADFLETFRGVTAYGANGFAACGLYADVRLSSNGTNWPAAVSGHIGLPDLYAIAYDGAQTLVAVGATNSGSSDNGVVMASINGSGTSWKTVYVNSTANTPINAVTYTGSGFIAVGDKGLVLTSPDGVNWTPMTSSISPANINLNGVAYANNGPLIGVAELVGDSGAVILASTPPPSPINPVGTTVCSAYPNALVTLPLSVSLVTDANHPAGTVSVDWYDARTNLMASGTTIFFPTNNPNLRGANAVSNIVFYAVERDLRTGFSSTNRTAVTLQITPRPSATLVTPNTAVCNVGLSYALTNVLTGIGPWTVVWNDGTIQTAPQTGPGPVNLTRTVVPTNSFASVASNNVYYVTIVTNADMCQGNVAGDILGTNIITVNPLPTVTLTITTNDFALSTNGVATGLLESVGQLSGTSYKLIAGFQYLQNGNPKAIGNQTLSVTNHLTFTGIGPWTVVVSDGKAAFVTNFPANGAFIWKEIISTNFNTNFTFSVTSLTDSNTGCSGSETNVYSVGVFGAPTAAVIHSANTVCGSGSDSVSISATLGGFGPWTNIVWSDGFTNDLVTSSSFNRSITAPTNNSFAQIQTNYSIVGLTDVNGTTTISSNNFSGATTLIVDPFPTNAPTVMVDTNYTCPEVSVLLSVSVPANFTADWYADSGLTTNLAMGTTNYTASITDEPGTNDYYVTMRYNDAFSLANCSPEVAAEVYLISQPCTNDVSSITFTNSSVIVSWYGNYVLQGTTNLIPPTVWFNLSTGELGPNFLTNSVLNGAPYEFFRLYAPTN